jgi:hypothetical protein
MIRIFYNPTTGSIHSSTTVDFADTSDLPHIDVEEQIRLCDWRVNTQTKELEPLQVIATTFSRR